MTNEEQIKELTKQIVDSTLKCFGDHGEAVQAELTIQRQWLPLLKGDEANTLAEHIGRNERFLDRLRLGMTELVLFGQDADTDTPKAVTTIPTCA